MTLPSYRAGSKEDFDRLYETSYQRIFRTLLAILRDRPAAEDCTQEAFLRAFRGWKTWKDDAPAEAWLHRIAINVAISHRRREQIREVGALMQRLGRPPETSLSEPSLGPHLLRELRALPPKQSAAIVLRHLHGYTNREIAAALHVPERTIASRLAAARARLRARIDGFSDAEMGTSDEGAVLPYE